MDKKSFEGYGPDAGEWDLCKWDICDGMDKLCVGPVSALCDSGYLPCSKVVRFGEKCKGRLPEALINNL